MSGPFFFFLGPQLFHLNSQKVQGRQSIFGVHYHRVWSQKHIQSFVSHYGNEQGGPKAAVQLLGPLKLGSPSFLCWFYSVVVSVMPKNIPCRDLLRAPNHFSNFKCSLSCVFSSPSGNNMVCTLTLFLLQHIILLALLLQPESAARTSINHSHWSDIFR